MPEASKKQTAFKLFNEGLKPDDPKIDALGLAPNTARKYYSIWKAQAESPEEALYQEPAPSGPPPVAVPQEVPVETLPDQTVFEYKGMSYIKTKQVYSGEVIARRVVGPLSTIRATGTAEFKPGVKVMKK